MSYKELSQVNMLMKELLSFSLKSFLIINVLVMIKWNPKHLRRNLVDFDSGKCLHFSGLES